MSKNKISFGAVIGLNICAIFLASIFWNPVTFYLNKVETFGVVKEIDPSYAKVEYQDLNGNWYVVQIKRGWRNKNGTKGDKVKIFYRKNDSADYRIPKFMGSEPYLLYVVFLGVSLFVMVSTIWDYLKE